MKKNGRLCYLRFLQVTIGAVKHYVGNIKAQDLISFIKHFPALILCLIQVLAHATELCSLPGKYKCFHINVTCFLLNE